LIDPDARREYDASLAKAKPQDVPPPTPKIPVVAKVKPGPTVREDKAVQTGLDFASDTARRGTRQLMLAIVGAAFIGGASYFLYRSLGNPSSPWEYEKIDLEVGPEGIATAIDFDKKTAMGIDEISHSSLSPREEVELISNLWVEEGEPGLGEVIISRMADCNSVEFVTLSLPSNEKLESRRIDYSNQMTGIRFKLKPLETAAVRMRNSGNTKCSFFQIDRKLNKTDWNQDDEDAREEIAQAGAITRSNLGWTYSAEGLKNRLASAYDVRGQAAFAKCAACHTVNEGGMNGIGPNLFGVLGRDIASRNGFTYSTSLSDKDGKWDFAKLDLWLARPKLFAPGTKMSFTGLSNAQERADLIVYLNLQGSLIPRPDVPSE
jgi:cytochrome c2